jgi:hypothetical protein
MRFAMSSMHLTFIVIIAVLIALGVGTTVWTAWRRREIDRAGTVKGESRNPAEVKAQNPPDRDRRQAP